MQAAAAEKLRAEKAAKEKVKNTCSYIIV